MKLPDKLYQLRKQRGLTLKELSEAVGITAAALSSYEKGQKEPSLSFAKRLAEYFGVSLDYLCGLDDSDTNTRKNKQISRADIIERFTDLCETGLPIRIERKSLNKNQLAFRYPPITDYNGEASTVCVNLASLWLLVFAEKYNRLLQLYIEQEIDLEVLEAFKEKYMRIYANDYNLTDDDPLPWEDV
ncbi:MAG: helix-turn-helix transcriptional regulator [Clostridia bacterium]|nr:helix-turn-helix transcriptional regulator [Clostridia bacterium]